MVTKVKRVKPKPTRRIYECTRCGRTCYVNLPFGLNETFDTEQSCYLFGNLKRSEFILIEEFEE